MKVVVQQLFEEGGRPVPNWRVTVKPKYEGQLHLTNGYLRGFARNCVIASLKCQTGGGDVLPNLIDASVVYINGNVITIAGIECDELTRKHYRQSWYIEVISP